MRTTIVVPCYNEAKRLPRQAFLDFSSTWSGGKLLFVNDGSRDETAAVITELAEQRPGAMAAMSLEKNGGKAEAVRQGVLRAFADGADAVGFWDADLATALEVIPQFQDVLVRQSNIDIVMGARVRLLGNAVERRPGRHYLGRGFATVVSWLLATSVYDTQCGAKLFRATPLVRDLFQAPFLSRWVFDVEILARYLDGKAALGQEGRRGIREIPLEGWRDVAGSKVRSQDFVRAGLDLARISLARRRRS